MSSLTLPNPLSQYPFLVVLILVVGLHFFFIAYGCFHTATAGLSTCDRNHMAYKAENIYYLSLCRESLPIPALQERKGIINSNEG